MQHNSDYNAKGAAEAGVLARRHLEGEIDLEARKPQRVRAQDERERAPAKRRCQARIEVPDRTGEGVIIFTCNRGSHSATPGDHREEGRIQLKDGTVAAYSFEWYVANVREVWRGARTNS